MSRIETILTNVRIPLNDRNKERWSDADLLLFLDKGQKDLTKECNILKDWVILPLSMGQSLYYMPDNTIEVIECRFDGEPMVMKTVEEMDKLRLTGQLVVKTVRVSSSAWESQITDDRPTHIVYNKQRRRLLRVWPTPVGEELTLVETDQATALGITVSVDEFTMIGEEGVAASILDTDAGIAFYENGHYGVLVEIVEQAAILVHRSKLSNDLTTVDDDLQVDIICDEALEKWIIAMAYANDQLEANRNESAQALAWYKRQVEIIKENVSIQAVVNENRETSYSGMGQ